MPYRPARKGAAEAGVEAAARAVVVVRAVDLQTDQESLRRHRLLRNHSQGGQLRIRQ